MTPYELSIQATKTVIVLLVLFVTIRLLGKRQAGQMNVYDLATLMAVANAVQNAITGGKGHLLLGVVTSTTLVAAGFLVNRLLVKRPALQSHLMGTPTVLVNNGQLQERAMRRERITENELLAVARQHAVLNVAQIDLAVLEVDGSISIVPSTDDEPPKKNVKVQHRRRKEK